MYIYVYVYIHIYIYIYVYIYIYIMCIHYRVMDTILIVYICYILLFW